MHGTISSKGEVTVPHPVDRIWATLPLERPVDEILDEMRGPRPELERLPGGEGC